MNHESARALRSRIPVAEVIDDSGQKAGLGHTEQEAQHVEARRPLHVHHRDGQDAPRDHDARDPKARADAHEDQIARHLEERIADEEHACAEAVDHGAEPQVGVHLQRREADIDAVEPRDDVEQQQERQEAPPNLRERGPAEVRRGVARSGDHKRFLGKETRIVGWCAHAQQPLRHRWPRLRTLVSSALAPLENDA